MLPPIGLIEEEKLSAESDSRLGKTRPRMTDVAALAGVSPMTVSRAFKTPDRVSKDARERITQAVEALGYVLDQTAGTLASNRSGFIAALVPSINSSNFSDTIRGLSDAVEKEGLQLLLGYTDHSMSREEQLIETMLRRRPEGVVLTGGQHSERSRRILADAGVPVIETWDIPAKPIGGVVGFSNQSASRALVRRLVEQGYKEIGFIGNTTDRESRNAERCAGYEEAIAEAGQPKGRIISFGRPPISMEQGAEALVQLLTRYPNVDAVVCVSDLSAFGAIMECHRRGWSVPGRIAIAGFGNFEVASSCYPRISTVAINCYEMGQSAGQLVLRLIAANAAGEIMVPETVLMPFQVLERESTQARNS
jgi:LacI family transcriptional regulator, gluconate utilization system Gnt-I transcriptional repressor